MEMGSSFQEVRRLRCVGSPRDCLLAVSLGVFTPADDATKTRQDVKERESSEDGRSHRDAAERQCPVCDLLAHLGYKWSMLVLVALATHGYVNGIIGGTPGVGAGTEGKQKQGQPQIAPLPLPLRLRSGSGSGRENTSWGGCKTRRLGYSSRRATMGSTLLARQAGLTVAANATPANKPGTPPNLPASTPAPPHNRPT